MAKTTYFVQECPTCGRALHVRVEYLGKRLVCQHCGGALIASDPEGVPSRASRLLERADALLQSNPLQTAPLEAAPYRTPGCA
jgi:hypothetical protein